MGKVLLILVVLGCVVTLALFGVMGFLMQSINPDPLPEIEERKDEGGRSSDDAILRKSGPRDPKYEFIHLPPYLPGDNRNYTTEDYNHVLKYTVKRVVPPKWPMSPLTPTQIKDPPGIIFKSPNKTFKFTTEKTINLNDTIIHVKRSVDDINKLGNDLNSIILKITDDSGQFNIEIKIASNNAIAKRQIEPKISENKTEFKSQSKYSMSLKAKNNRQFKKSELTKNTVISVMPNDTVVVNAYDDYLTAENEERKNVIQVNIQNISTNIVDVFNSTSTTQYNITGNTSTVVPI